jgi:hypothetical protein
VIVERPLPQGSGGKRAQFFRRPALEKTHEIEERGIDVEGQKVKVIRHDAVAEDTPGLAVKAANFADDEIGVFRIGEYPSTRIGAGGQEGGRARLGVNGRVETDRFATRFWTWHGGRLPGVVGTRSETVSVGRG